MPLRAAVISSKVTAGVTDVLPWAHAGHAQEIRSRQMLKLRSGASNSLRRGAEKKFRFFIIVNGN